MGDFLSIILGEKYAVSIQKILSSGVIVELDGGETGFIHKSKISNEFIDSIENFVSVGDNYTATAVEGKDKPVELSLRLDNDIKRKADAVEVPAPIKPQRQNRKSQGDMSLEEMIAQSTASMREKFQGRDKITGARYKKSRRVGRNK